METDFSGDSKHSELLTQGQTEGEDTQTHGHTHTHTAVVSVDTPGCKARRTNHITGTHMHTFIQYSTVHTYMPVYSDAYPPTHTHTHTHTHILANTHHVQADKSDGDKSI